MYRKFKTVGVVLMIGIFAMFNFMPGLQIVYGGSPENETKAEDVKNAEPEKAVEKAEDNDNKTGEISDKNDDAPDSLMRNSVAEEASSDDNTGIQVDFNMKWSMVNSKDNKDFHVKDDTDVVYTPQDNSLQIASLVYTVKINNDNGVLPEGAIKMTVPNYLFQSWSGERNLNLKANYEFGAFPEVQLPMAPAMSDVIDFNYVDQGDGTWLVTNCRPIVGTKVMEFTQSYKFMPSLVKVDKNGNASVDLKAECTFDLNGDGKEDKTVNKGVRAEIHNFTVPLHLKLGKYGFSAFKPQPEDGIFYNWQENWGEKPADSDKYFYVVWSADIIRHDNVIPCDLEFSPEESDGELIGAVMYKKTDKRYFINYMAIWNSMGNDEKGNTDNIAKAGYEKYFKLPVLYDRLNTSELTADNERIGALWLNGYNQNTEYHSGKKEYNNVTRILMLKRYPISLIDDARARGVDMYREGITLKNKASVKTVYRNGKVVPTDAVEAEAKIIIPPKGVNSLSKYTPDYYGWMGPGMTVIKENLDYELRARNWPYSYKTHFTGHSLEADKYGNTKDYIVEISEKPYIAEGITDIHKQTTCEMGYKNAKELGFDKIDEDIEYNQVSLKVSFYRARKNNADVFEPELIKDYSKTNPGKIEIYTLDKDGKESRYGTVSFDGKGESYIDRGEGKESLKDKDNIIKLPKGVRTLKYKVITNAYKFDLDADTVTTLKSTENSRKIIDDIIQRVKDQYNQAKNTFDWRAKNIYVISAAEAKVFYDGDKASETHTTYNQSNYRSSMHFTPVYPLLWAIPEDFGLKDDKVLGKQSRTQQFRFSIDCNNGGLLANASNESTKMFSDMIHFKTAQIYNLLPAGTTYSEPVLRYGRSHWDKEVLTKGDDYDYEILPYWNGTNQTMLIFKLHPREEILNKYGNSLSNYFSLAYELMNTYANISDRGHVVRNIAAAHFDLEKEFGTNYGVKTNEYDYTSLFEPFSGGDYKNWALARTKPVYNPITVLEAGMHQSVRSYGEKFGDKANVGLGENYEYRINYANDSVSRSDNMVFYNVLENGEKSQWQGEFVSVDVSPADSKPTYDASEHISSADDTCAPVVYYATEIPEAFNVDDSAVWSTQIPEDKRSIKAIAVDCRKTDKGKPFILDQASSLGYSIIMKAPTDKKYIDKTSENNAAVSFRAFVGEDPGENNKNIMLNSPVYTTLEPYKIEIEKSSDPINLDSLNPTPIVNSKGEKLTYRIKVTNKDIRPLSNIVIKDDISNLLNIGNVTVNSKLLNLENANLTDAEAKGVRISQNGNELIANIRALKEGESIEIAVPTNLKESVRKTTVIKNKAKIIEVNGAQIDKESNSVAHKLEKTYTVKYKVSGDKEYGSPRDSTVPKDATSLEYGSRYTVSPAITTEENGAIRDGKAVRGRWQFSGWYKGDKKVDELTIENDEELTGKWKFFPNTKLTVSKKWNNQQSKPLTEMPEEIGVRAYTDSGLHYDGILKTKEGKYTFEELPSVDENFNHLEYRICELDQQKRPVEDGQTVTYEGKDYKVTYDGNTIINTLINPMQRVEVVKVWDDDNDRDGIRPESVSVELKGGKTIHRIIKLEGEGNRWSTELKDLPTYDENGVLIEYSLSERRVNGYEEPQIKGNIEDGFEITNKHKPEETVIDVTKTWKDNNDAKRNRPKSVVIELIAKDPDKDKSETVDRITLNSENGWKGSFNAQKIYENGKRLAFSVAEIPVEGYRTEYSGNEATGFEVVNRKVEPWTPLVPAQTSLDVTKEWKGIDSDKAPEIKVYLVKNGEKTEQFILLNRSNGWHGTFKNLSIKDNMDSKCINEYSLLEEGETDGQVTVDGSKYAVTYEKGKIINTKIEDKKPAEPKADKGKPASPAKPVTGDSSNLMLYIGILAGAVMGFMLLILSRFFDRHNCQ